MNDRFDPDIEAQVSAAFERAPLVAAPAALRDAVAADRAERVAPARAARRDAIPRPFAALVGIAAAVVVVAGTAAYFATRPTDTGGHGGQPAVATATSPDGLKLSMKVARTQVAAGEVIEATATLVYDGPNASITVGGSGADGVVYFGVRQLDGALRIDPASRESCGSYTFKRGAEASFPFQKSGGYLNEDTPQDRFAQQYFSTKQLMLPAGRWEVYAELMYGVRECGGQQRDVKAPVTVTVGSGPAPSPTPVPSSAPASRSKTTRDGIMITISSPHSTYAAGEPIPLTGSIRYDGPDESLTAYGSGMGIVTFGFRRLGSDVEYLPAVTADCGPHALQRGTPNPVKFVNGYSPSGQTGDDVFIREHDGAAGLTSLTLPAGSWDVFVETDYATQPCAAGVSFVKERATIQLTIVDAAKAPVSIEPAPTTAPTPPATKQPAAELRGTQTVTTSDGIEMTISTPKTTYAPDEAITVTTTTRYAGPDGIFKLTRSGSGLVAFEVTQLDGTLTSGYAQTADCRPDTLVRGAVTTIPFGKSGGYANDGSVSDNFRKQYLSQPELVLPAGRWEIVAHLLYGDASCSVATRDEVASVIVDVR